MWKVRRFVPGILLLVLSLLCPGRGVANPTVEVVLMEPAGTPEEGKLPHYRLLEDGERRAAIEGWLDNEAARFAQQLYARAWVVGGLPVDGASVRFYIAVAPGGNHADNGFALDGDERDGKLVDLPYVILDERPFRYEQTLLHETGHMVLDLLGAAQVAIDGGYVFHTTPAVTDRWTAFNEGFAIHLETLYMERASDPGRRMHYDNRSPVFGERSPHRFGPLDDLRTLSQTRQRFTAVRDNRFAHPAAYQGDDLLRHAVDPERDLSRLRNASQLLACEGFAAAVFYRLVTAPAPEPTLDSLDHGPLMEALVGIFHGGLGAEDHTWLVHLVESLARTQPGAREIFVDLTRGATLSSEVVAMWPELYAHALRVDVRGYGELQGSASALLDGWMTALDSGEVTLSDAVGPEVWATVEGVTVRPQLMPEDVPLCLDLNAADRAELAAVPGADAAWVDRVLTARLEAPFESIEDLLERSVAPEGLDAFLVAHDPTGAH